MTMKRISIRSFVWLAVLLLAATACVEPVGYDNPTEATVPFKFKVLTSDGIPQTKSTDGLINGIDATVTTLYMYCFDVNGRYLGRFSATKITSTGGSTSALGDVSDDGTFEGQVPPATARVHFVANADIPVGNDKIGMTEEDIFHGQDESTWGLTACRRDMIAYWGYFKAATAQEMAEIFDPYGSTITTIYLLRDRARIEAGSFATTSPNDIYNPASVQWTIYNGLSTGYVAPYNSSTKFEGYYKNVDGEISESSTLTPQANPKRDVTDGDDLKDFKKGSYMYAFEDDNIIDGNDVSKAIRIIVKVETKTTPAQTLYFPVRLTDAEGVEQLKIKRGHRYVLNLGALPVGLGYDTFAEAAAATSFANGQLVSIPMVVPEVSDGRFDLKVEYLLGEDGLTSTSALFQEFPDGNPVVRIPFLFKRSDSQPVVATDFNFTANWTTEGQNVADPDYDEDTEGIKIITDGITTDGKGYVEIKLKSIDNTLKSGVIRLLEKNNKLERNIYIYSIKLFHYKDLQLVHTSGNNYRLYLELPNGTGYSEYPEGLYPIKVKIASKSLQPNGVWNGNTGYSSMTSKSNVTFGVEVKSTGTEVPGIVNQTNTSQWNYQEPQWNFWYIYTITEKEGPCYYIDFTDVRNSYASGNRPSNLGLYFRIEFFGETSASEAIPRTAQASYVNP